MSSTENAVVEIEPRFAPGELCGGCRFPVGPGQICGNPVYASAGKGALPKYCGADGQTEWQTKFGTPGVAGHMSDRAGYPRKLHKMTPADVKTLAEARAAELGVHRSAEAPVVAAVPASDAGIDAPIDTAESAPTATAAEAPTVAPTEAPAVRVLAEGTDRRALDKTGRLGELLLAATELAAELRGDIEAIRTDAESRVQREVERTREAVEARELAEARLSEVSAEAQAQVTSARAEAQDAIDAKLRAEGETRAAKDRIAELEARLAAADARTRTEVERARDAEWARIERVMSFPVVEQQTIRPQAWTPETPTESAVRDMAKRIGAGTITRDESVGWIQGGSNATRPAAWTLDWMYQNGYLDLRDGATGAAVLTDQGQRYA